MLLVLTLAGSVKAEPSLFDLDYVAEAECLTEQGFRALVEQQLVDYDQDIASNAPARVVARFERSEARGNFGHARPERRQLFVALPLSLGRLEARASPCLEPLRAACPR